MIDKEKKIINTNVPWMPEIPSTWRLMRGKYLFKSEKVINDKMQCKDRLGLTLNGVIDRFEGDQVGLNPNDLRTYQIFNENELVFKLIDLENKNTSRVGFVHKKGIMSSAYIRLVNNRNVNMKFFYYQYYDLYQRFIFNMIGQGVRATMSSSDLLDIPIVIPPIKVQNSIVEYLDKKISDIDKFIQNKLKLINLLIEEKIAIINIYVSQGNNTSTEFQDCLVKWINKIPNNWKQKKLKYLLIESNKRSKDGKEQLLSLSKYKGVVPQNEIDSQIARASSLIGYKYVEPNDIVINKMQANNGLVGLSQIYGITSPDYSIYKIKEEYYPQYLGLLLSSKFYVANYNLYSKGVMDGYVRLYTDDLFNIYGIVPPIDEQKNIVEIIEKKHNELNLLISKAQKELTLIKQYRNSLITEIVTGQRNITKT